MKKIDINEIDYSLTYEGYLWYSNQTKPKIVIGNLIAKEIFTKLPFIIEGNLYCSENGLSISIKNVDGEYQVHQAILKDLPKDQCSNEEYLAHDLDKIEKIKMVQYWEESQADELLAGMTTLIPTWQAFKGFIQ